jgi:valyl-tRNA synthetase
VLDQCLILLHPIMPFITEELWGQTTRPKPLIHTDWPTYGDLTDAAAHTEMTWAIAMIDNIRSARSQMNVPAGLYVPVLQLDADQAAQNAWTRNETLIKRLARIDSLTPATQAPKGAITVATPGATFAIPLADIIDVAAEKTRLTKGLEKLTKEINGLQGRLNNPNFATSAPADVVAEAQTNLTARQDEATQLSAAIARLAELS